MDTWSRAREERIVALGLAGPGTPACRRRVRGCRRHYRATNRASRQPPKTNGQKFSGTDLELGRIDLQGRGA